tara:strand:+ start:161 stop:601 length:441 start_codon:yes stop_codon:yes gene_type:complete
MRKVIVLKEVQKSDYSFLYELLSERKLYENISHKKNPTYAKHIKFVMSKPYTKWYIIYYGKEKIGSIYITKQDEVGIHFKEQLQANLKPKSALWLQVLKIMMKKNPRNRYLVNINPSNTGMKNFLKNAGFELIQYTYEVPKRINRG